MKERLLEQLKHLAAEFLRYEGNNSSLITVTNASMSKDGKSATIFFTVLPFEAQRAKEGRTIDLEKTALEFAKRKRSEFKQYVKENSPIGRIPLIDFEIDRGEKNRQRIDELSTEYY